MPMDNGGAGVDQMISVLFFRQNEGTKARRRSRIAQIRFANLFESRRRFSKNKGLAACSATPKGIVDLQKSLRSAVIVEIDFRIGNFRPEYDSKARRPTHPAVHVLIPLTQSPVGELCHFP